MEKSERSIPLYQPLLAALLEAYGERLKTIVLFGSQARGEARLDSDHDLLVIIEDLPGNAMRRQREVRLSLIEVIHLLPGAVTIVAKTPQELQSNLTPMLLDVCVDGVCLYGAEFFEPYRKKALSALSQAGLRRKRQAGVWIWLFPKPASCNWELTWEGYRELTE